MKVGIVCTGMHSVSKQVEAREQLTGVSSFLPLSGYWDWNSGPQSWLQCLCLWSHFTGSIVIWKRNTGVNYVLVISILLYLSNVNTQDVQERIIYLTFEVFLCMF